MRFRAGVGRKEVGLGLGVAVSGRSREGNGPASGSPKRRLLAASMQGNSIQDLFISAVKFWLSWFLFIDQNGWED